MPVAARRKITAYVSEAVWSRIAEAQRALNVSTGDALGHLLGDGAGAATGRRK